MSQVAAMIARLRVVQRPAPLDRDGAVGPRLGSTGGGEREQGRRGGLEANNKIPFLLSASIKRPVWDVGPSLRAVHLPL